MKNFKDFELTSEQQQKAIGKGKPAFAGGKPEWAGNGRPEWTGGKPDWAGKPEDEEPETEDPTDEGTDMG